MVDGCVSELCPVVSGVPQGAILGPPSPGTCALSFADDSRVVRGIKSANDGSIASISGHDLQLG